MKRKIIVYSLVFLSVMTVTVWVNLAGSMPLNLNVWGASLSVVLLDFYLWGSLSERLKPLKGLTVSLLTLLFWFPFALYTGGLIYSAWIPFIQWPPLLRTWYFGLLVLGYGSKFVPALIFLVSDVLGWACRTIGQCKPIARVSDSKDAISRSRFIRNLGLLGGGVIFSGMLAGILKWVDDFRIRRVDIPLSKLPSSFDGFRIVQISDLHLGTWTSAEPLEEAVRLITDLNPDLVVFTGDLVNYSSEEVLPFRQVLKKIRATHGVLAILGNHDYGGYVRWKSNLRRNANFDNLLAFYKDIGWKLLRNESYILNRNGSKIAILGVENWGAKKRFPRRGDIGKSRSGTEDIPLKILLSHDPAHWEYVVSREEPDIALTLSGHTHGMQMGFETSRMRWSPAQYVYKYWAGLYSHPQREQYLYVNRGIGSIGYPGRIGIFPEITLLTLRHG